MQVGAAGDEIERIAGRFVPRFGVVALVGTDREVAAGQHVEVGTD